MKLTEKELQMLYRLKTTEKLKDFLNKNVPKFSNIFSVLEKLESDNLMYVNLLESYNSTNNKPYKNKFRGFYINSKEGSVDLLYDMWTSDDNFKIYLTEDGIKYIERQLKLINLKNCI